MATSNAPDPSTRMAARGSAIRVISEPKIETVAAVQTRAKAAFRQSREWNGLRTIAEHTRRRAAADGPRTVDRVRPALQSACLGASEPAHHPARS